MFKNNYTFHMKKKNVEWSYIETIKSTTLFMILKYTGYGAFAT